MSSRPVGTAREDAARAVTWLFVPGDRPERFGKALGSGADEVICDLEDAVAPGAKDHARTEVGRWLGDTGRGWVRVNGADTPWFEADVDALAGLPGLRGLVIPKADDTSLLGRVRRTLGDVPGIVALVETASGVARACDLAGSGVVDRLAFGSIDYAVDVDASEDDESLLLARTMLVLASRLGGIAAPVDGVTRGFDDPQAVREEAGRSRRLGFTGKLCIHPAQLDPVAEAFRPTKSELAWARAVLAAVGEGNGDQRMPGAVALGGQMVDKPVLERARRIVERAR